ncbi:MAG: aminotransferase class I/II-fold pyridoxal phosphate-dependent enzyme [Legionellaceae bacterium]|nr:aminotransferase class I/II-fold pyridoxal phosphate-dependent enzyme [Legionellaceae bacterium]
MLKPNGLPADDMDKIMLLAEWAKTLADELPNQQPSGDTATQNLIAAGMGKPTFPMNMHTVRSELVYWQAIEARVHAALNSISDNKEDAVIGYGNPQGDEKALQIMATAMSDWYQTVVEPKDVLFTVGGAGALRVIFETFNLIHRDMPNYRVITPFPHYTLYADNSHQLHPIDVMKEPGYVLTAKSLQLSIDSAYSLAKKDNGYPKAFLLCNPNNPLGTIISPEELERIAEVLRQYPDIHIIVDEAYAEMCFDSNTPPSLLTIAPDLKNRMVILRSATKALSAAGERMAILMAFDNALMGKLLNKNIGTLGHAPRSSQIAYAETMAQFNAEEHQKLVDFYHPKVDLVSTRLNAMGASMPDTAYKVNGTFYIMGDFSDLLGMALPSDAERALGKSGVVTTNEDLAYYLLFKDLVMIAPSAYFGMPDNNGFMRITCSGTSEQLNILMSRIETRLVEARKIQRESLLNEIGLKLSVLKEINKDVHDNIVIELTKFSEDVSSCKALKEQNKSLKKMALNINQHINCSTKEGAITAAIKIQAFYRGHLAKVKTATISDELQDEWRSFVNTKMNFGVPGLQAGLLALPNSRRLESPLWIDHLKEITNKSSEMGPKKNE